jgi:hypothetical protein
MTRARCSFGFTICEHVPHTDHIGEFLVLLLLLLAVEAALDGCSRLNVFLL